MRCRTALTKPSDNQRSAGNRSDRMSSARITGNSAAPNRAPKVSRPYFPASTFAQVSRLGVAEASTTGNPAIAARSTAISRAW